MKFIFVEFVCFLNVFDILVKIFVLIFVVYMDWLSGWKSLK